MKRFFGFVKRRWFFTFVGGIVLFIASVLGLSVTGNPNFVPTVLLVGAFTVPVTFVTYFSEREHAIDKEIQHELPLSVLITCFLVGGILGVAAAGIVEYETLKKLTVPGLFAVGLIEESAKLIIPIALL